MADFEVYAFCEANCKHRVLTADQTIALVEEVLANGGQVPEQLVLSTPIREIIDQNTGTGLKFFVGTQAEWDSWTGDKTNVFAIISDDPIQQDIFNKLDALTTASNYANERIDKIIDGSTVVAKATDATNDGSGREISATYSVKPVDIALTGFEENSTVGKRENHTITKAGLYCVDLQETYNQEVFRHTAMISVSALNEHAQGTLTELYNGGVIEVLYDASDKVITVYNRGYQEGDYIRWMSYCKLIAAYE